MLLLLQPSDSSLQTQEIPDSYLHTQYLPNSVARLYYAVGSVETPPVTCRHTPLVEALPFTPDVKIILYLTKAEQIISGNKVIWTF